MRVWIDTEFNGFHGELISIGMIAENGHHFYEWFDIGYKNLDPWVQVNVHPYLPKGMDGEDSVEPVTPDIARQRLTNFFLNIYKGYPIEFIADWPEDVHHLCEFMITGPGLMIGSPSMMRFTIDRTLNGRSTIPHNALFDAIGNMEEQLSREQMIRQSRRSDVLNLQTKGNEL